MATSTASGHHVVDLFDATASPAEIAACSWALMGGNGIRLPRTGHTRTRSSREPGHRSAGTSHGPCVNKQAAAPLLPGHRSFKDHGARRRIRLHAVFRRDEDFKILVRGGCFKAAFQIFIHAESAQQLRVLATRLHPDQVRLFGRRERLWRCHVLYMDFNAGVAIAIVIGNDLAFRSRSSSGVGEPVFSAPGGGGKQKAEQQKQSDSALAHDSFPLATTQVRDKMYGGGNNVAANAEQDCFAIMKAAAAQARADFPASSAANQLWPCSFSSLAREFRAASKLGSRSQASII